MKLLPRLLRSMDGDGRRLQAPDMALLGRTPLIRAQMGQEHGAICGLTAKAA